MNFPPRERRLPWKQAGVSARQREIPPRPAPPLPAREAAQTGHRAPQGSGQSSQREPVPRFAGGFLHGGKFNAADGFVQDAPVASNALQEARARTGAHNSNFVSRLHLAVDEVRQGGSHPQHSLKGKYRIIHHHHEPAWLRGRITETGDGHGLARHCEIEIRSRQSCHRASGGIGHYRIHL